MEKYKKKRGGGGEMWSFHSADQGRCNFTILNSLFLKIQHRTRKSEGESMRISLKIMPQAKEWAN